VVNRRLQRRDYEIGEDGKLTEEVAKILWFSVRSDPTVQAGHETIFAVPAASG
jgi:hypothetical protein